MYINTYEKLVYSKLKNNFKIITKKYKKNKSQKVHTDKLDFGSLIL